MYQRYGKRMLDIICSLCGVVLFSPVFLILAVWIKLDSPGPVFFKQKRVGKHKTYFNILKFRTMRTDAPHDMPTHLLENPEAFITRSGAFLRRTSLDELPQIINILMGDMSVVGPRPALWNQDDLLAERDRYGANDVTPGLTGWAQVNGRDELEIEEKARLDGEYVCHLTLKMDATCVLMTVGSVLRQKGVVEGGTGTLVPHIEARKHEIREHEEELEQAYGGKNSA
ncbi:MAG: sugar transferase [Clostridia bacterium]|nr:sugar transferase [Clostridia bacterium]